MNELRAPEILSQRYNTHFVGLVRKISRPVLGTPCCFSNNLACHPVKDMRGALKVKLQNALNQAILGSAEDRGIFVGGRRRNRKRRRNRNGKDKKKNKKSDGKDSPVIGKKDPVEDQKPLIETDFNVSIISLSDCIYDDSYYGDEYNEDDLPALVHSNTDLSSTILSYTLPDKEADYNNNDKPETEKDYSRNPDLNETTGREEKEQAIENQNNFQNKDEIVVNDYDLDVSDDDVDDDVEQDLNPVSQGMSLQEELDAVVLSESICSHDIINPESLKIDIAEEMDEVALPDKKDDETDDDNEEGKEEDIIFSREVVPTFESEVVTVQPQTKTASLMVEKEEKAPLLCKDIDPNCLCCVIL